MFQTDDFDEDILNDFLEPNRKETENFNFNPVNAFPEVNKNKCFEFSIPSTSKTNQNILNVLSKTRDDNNLRKINNNRALFTDKKSPDKIRKVIQRKFPGPAGLLPKNKIDVNLKNLEKIDFSVNKPIAPDEIICSQLSGNCFNESPWIDMCNDYYIEDVRLYLPEKYSISWAKTKAMSKQLLRQKTPFLAAVIKSIDYTIKNPMVILKDPTGEMAGTLHHDVWEEHSEKLTVGSVIVLRQVGVLTTTKKYYLNITSNNIITIYHFQDTCLENSSQTKNVEVFRIINATALDIKNSIESYKREILEMKNNSYVEENDNPFFKQNLSINSPLFSISNNTNINYSSGPVNKENNITNNNFQNRNILRASSYGFNNQNNYNSTKNGLQSNLDIISGSEREKSYRELLENKIELNKCTENIKNSSFQLEKHKNYQETFKKRKLDNNLNIHSKSCDIISGTPEIIGTITRFETKYNDIKSPNNIMKKVFSNVPNFNFAPKYNIPDCNKTKEFLTSTQNDVSDSNNVFCEEENLLDGLEASFLEDF